MNWRSSQRFICTYILVHAIAQISLYCAYSQKIYSTEQYSIAFAHADRGLCNLKTNCGDIVFMISLDYVVGRSVEFPKDIVNKSANGLG